MKKIYSTLLVLAVCSFSAKAQTVSLSPAKDNSIFSDQLNNSTGNGPLFSGSTCFQASRRALMQFDVSSIPSGAVITSATLTVNVNLVSLSGSGGPDTYNLHALTTEFGEGASTGSLGLGVAAVAPDATWSDAMFGTSTWTVPGGDFVPTSLTSVAMPLTTGASTFPTSANFVAAVQAWVDTPASNFGVIMIGNEATTCTARRFDSREGTVPPVLSITYTMPCPGPTAVCQDISVYLDPSGNASIADADIDGGSTDDCMTSGLTYAASQTSFSCTDLGAGSGGGGLLITGVYDGPLPGGLPKGVELYAGSAIADLSNYGIGSANNGGGTDGEEFTFPSVSVAAGTFLYITTDSAGFNNYFGFDPDFVDGSMGINGDDAVELFQGGAVIDVFGDINTDGTGQPWEYLDGWAYRNDLLGANAGVFNSSNWSYSGINALDGDTLNSTATTPFPNGTYTAPGAGVAVTLTVTDGLGNSDMCTAFVTVLDTLAPVPNVATLPDVTSDCPVDSITPPVAADNCAGQFFASTSTTFPITSSTTVTWTFDDGNGNTVTQDQVVTINGLDLGVTIMAPSPTLMADATGVTYQWIDCSDSTAIAGETAQSFTASVTGMYAVIIDNGSCSDTSACVNVSIGGIDDLIDLGMKVAPNPSNGMFEVTFDNMVSGKVSIVDAKGKLIETRDVNSNTLTIDLRSNQSGLYFLNIVTEDGVARERIVKY